MTCWTRHITDIFDELGVAYNKENRIKVDKYIRGKYKLDRNVKCPEILKDYVKPEIADDKMKNEFKNEIKQVFEVK